MVRSPQEPLGRGREVDLISRLGFNLHISFVNLVRYKYNTGKQSLQPIFRFAFCSKCLDLDQIRGNLKSVLPMP